MPETLPASQPTPRTPPWWLWPHVLSLEAPLVAVLYQLMLMHVHGVTFTPMLHVGLGLACWVVYVLDRTLDTFGAKSEGGLDVRHAFYFRHRRVVLWLVLPVAAVVEFWLAFFVIPEGVLWQAAGLALLVALYLASFSAQGSRRSRDLLVMCAGLGAVLLISRLPASTGFRFVLSVMVLVVMVLSFLRQLDIRLGHFLPKEMNAALLFALGCTTSTRFFAMPDNLLQPVAECLLLALLFACNLHGISARERKNHGSHGLLVGGTLGFTLLILWMTHNGLLEQSLRGPAWVALVALPLHAAVQLAGRRVSNEAHHVLSDLALIVALPLAWL
ncbi:MAG TPA: hypothetical protein VGE39_19615 [Prosthecobacter sp.]